MSRTSSNLGLSGASARACGRRPRRGHAIRTAYQVSRGDRL